ncbi:MAG: bifunctional aspartate kinase/homoserine dehydrogenase II [Colwellia sp.]|nr:bifunctional aspartate kinase/homoserine dehydrogenase II [Colwellia sp.]
MSQSANMPQLSSVENQLSKHAIHVHKFGGSSLANDQCIERVVDIIRTNCQLNDLVVVSANGKTTDHLFKVLALADDTDGQLVTAIEILQTDQQVIIEKLLSVNGASLLTTLLKEDIKQLNQWLAEGSTTHYNDILSFGELWSARLLSAVLTERVCPSTAIDSRQFLVIDNEHNCNVDYEVSSKQLNSNLINGKLAVITGYISLDQRGNTCTLGRNGSDYSATIIAALVGALNVTLWTDVDGIYSADPRVVPTARKLHRLPNGVANELGRLGNPVLHANTLKPLVNSKNKYHTHLHVASSFDSEISGTEIGKFGQIAKQELSVTYLNDLLLAQSDSFKGMSGEQASSEFSAICADNNDGYIVIYQEQQKQVSQWLACHNTEVNFKPVSIIATVGHKVCQHGDIKARFKRALKSIQPLKLVHSKNSHSLIAVLSEVCTGELLNNVHHDMTKDVRHIGLVVAGLGNIGQRFLELLPAQVLAVPALENLHLVGLVSSKKALINTDGLDVNNALSEFNDSAQDYNSEQLLAWLANHPYDELIIVDITPSEQFSLLYGEFFKQGIHVCGANKWAASSATDHYNYLVNTAKSNDSLWLGNTTVGAGLPVNYAIDDLLQSGDKITEISGIFSGTLSWLFETYDGSQPFSELMLDALSQGITEPDPREDLSGRDVQRKLLILARMAGFTLSLEDISCNNLVPEELQGLSTAEFLARSSELDDFFAQQLSQAKANNACIRYIARFSATTDGSNKLRAEVSLEVLPNDDAFASITPCDNIFQIKSGWYQDNPLIIRGPGAGRDVTAGGLHSDLVKICQQVTNKQNQVKIKGIN